MKRIIVQFGEIYVKSIQRNKKGNLVVQRLNGKEFVLPAERVVGIGTIGHI